MPSYDLRCTSCAHDYEVFRQGFLRGFFFLFFLGHRDMNAGRQSFQRIGQVFHAQSVFG